MRSMQGSNHSDEKPRIKSQLSYPLGYGGPLLPSVKSVGLSFQKKRKIDLI